MQEMCNSAVLNEYIESGSVSARSNTEHGFAAPVFFKKNYKENDTYPIHAI